MIEATTVAQLRAELKSRRERGDRIALVPTMGNLHAGHEQLMEEARRHADTVVVSIYVNPLQFGPKEDFAAYPRTPAEDRAVLTRTGVDVLFLPDEKEMYPRGRERHTQVEVPGLSDILCGASRPGHFRGVTTVVARLFNVVGPDIAVFGKKDYQQLNIIRLMASDLGMPIDIIGVDTVRELDGLARSSRNNYLTPNERRIAPTLHQCLELLCHNVQAGSDFAVEEELAITMLQDAGFQPDYVSVRRRADLEIPHSGDTSLVVLAAAFLGRTRLIDNREFDRSPV